MDEARLPTVGLISWLPLLVIHLACGPRRKWRDVIDHDLMQLDLASDWYDLARNHHEWLEMLLHNLRTIRRKS